MQLTRLADLMARKIDQHLEDIIVATTKKGINVIFSSLLWFILKAT